MASATGYAAGKLDCALGGQNAMKVLDLGCGDGTTAVPAARTMPSQTRRSIQSDESAAKALKRIDNETSDYYVLGYYSKLPLDGSYRSLRDTVDHHMTLARNWRWWMRIVPRWPVGAASRTGWSF